MDIPRESYARKRRMRRVLYTVSTVLVVGAISIGLSRLEPAVPAVDRSTIWVDTVKRGPMLRSVRGLGTLVPIELRWIPATTSGRIERKVVEPGATVKPNTILLVLSNPELQQETVNARWDLKAAETSYDDLKVTLDSQHLNKESDVARVEAEYYQAKLQAEADRDLAKLGLVPELTVKLKEVTVDQLANRLGLEKQQLEKHQESMHAQLAVQQTRVEQMKALYELRKSQLDQLSVRSGVSGVLQIIAVDVGQQVTAGQNLARISDPTRLKAELRVAETQAEDVQIGQESEVDTRNGIVAGYVSRIDPSVQNGTVTIDVTLTGELPKGARPDLSVDGIIEIEQLDDVIYVRRPVHGQSNSMVGLFKLISDGDEARRVSVRLGRASVDTIEIVEGLEPGDKVILSDTSAQDDFDRLRITE